ncbi:Pyranose dehydrogenase [Paramyrothecium foliicola]|nr:Pyranose dehydrogenase [Paramyrothecium foliicola]
MASPTYDFIIVGAGPAGCALASGLARSSKKPTVLLLEAGGPNDDHNLRVDGQPHADNRELDYSRGKGLGGSSAINFGVYTVGARDDYEEWARIVGDDAYRWSKIQPRFKELETFHGDLPAGTSSKYAAPNAHDHGHSGRLHVGYAAEFEKDFLPTLDLFEEAGFPLNNDHNSGNPLGMSVLISSCHKGVRSTAKDLLVPQPENLVIVTNSPVQRVILQGTRAVGVECNGEQYFAAKEVVLSAGALDSPKILMHSGIGPKVQLQQFGIPVVKDMPYVGQGLRDHMFTPLVFTRTPGDTTRDTFYGNQSAMDEALEQWKKDGTGPWARYACELGIGWFKLDKLVKSEEFKALPAEEQAYLNQETVPHYEVITHFPMHWFIPEFPNSSLNYSCLLVFYFNAQSRGEATLQSADPAMPLRFDPKFLSTAFDRRAAIESLRDAMRFVESKGYAKDNVGMLAGPQGDGDDDLLAYWRSTISSSWHMTGTTKMGKKDDVDAVVDSNFCVIGFQGLRVVDNGVVPVLASCHIQAVAYVVGATAAEKLIAEYEL